MTSPTTGTYDQPRPKSREKESKEHYKPKEKYYVHPLLVEPVTTKLETDFDRFIPSMSELNANQVNSEGIWKWREEILRPGIDLKNKIVTLVEDTLNNWKKPKAYASKTDRYDKLTSGDFELPQKIPNEEPERDVSSKRCSCPPNRNSASTSPKEKGRNPEGRSQRTGHVQEEVDEGLDVAYVNPRATKWQEESMASFRLDSSDIDSLKYAEEKRINEIYKAEFRDTLSSTKDSDKVKLWHSICTQAKINGHTKDDKVTIQIPERKNIKGNKVVEIEYTLAELEGLLVGSRHSNHNHSRRKRSRH
ncbi:hypothetical protein NQ315_005317 [Exocentrus adspersus]|uniref:Uncharacterized protein n=1 Tax=Exocentrus adspersus TaxID=1586481 RepID=A0AAV8W1V1_9CUCU|nr:hypothetical protein NQ315_005317 [Exocentrus adspersus]